MGRFVGLYFEDNGDADKFIEEWNEPTDAISGRELVALFAVPTQFCECPHDDRTNPRRQVRGQKYGWWVHRDCGKPLVNGFQHPRNLLEKPKLGPGEHLGFTVNWMFRSGVMRGWKNS